MSKDSSPIYYQNTKERLQKNTYERYQSLSKEKKSDNTVKNLPGYEKAPYYNDKKLLFIKIMG